MPPLCTTGDNGVGRGRRGEPRTYTRKVTPPPPNTHTCVCIHVGMCMYACRYLYLYLSLYIYMHIFIFLDRYRPIYPSLDLALYIVGRLIPLPMPPLCATGDNGVGRGRCGEPRAYTRKVTPALPPPPKKQRLCFYNWGLV